MPEPVRKIVGKAAPLEMDDVDTDQIIPAQFLKVLSRKGLGKYLFYRWRFDEDGRPKEGFVLDRKEFRDAVILVAGRNFGIGSSRANAVWALMHFGIRCEAAKGSLTLEIDVETERIKLPSGETINFKLEPNAKRRLLEGLDEIEATLREYGERIREYEARMERFKMPRQSIIPLE
ncbi:MAG: 3-isopropylmalate dehydratase small subunit [Nitrososphaerota archaeon]